MAIYRVKRKCWTKNFQMALWRVLDLYKRDASRRGQAPAKPTHLNSDKKVNSKPSETRRSPLNRLANRPIILRSSANFEFLCLFFLPSVFCCVLFRAAFPCAVLFYYRKNHFSVLFEYDFTPWKRQKSTQNLFQPIHAFSCSRHKAVCNRYG